MTRLCLALLSLLLLSTTACEPVQVISNRRGDVDGRTYEFSSGGSFHPDGRGEWILRLRGDALWIARDRKGKITEYGTFKLSEPESDKLWRLVTKAQIASRPATARDDGGENVRYRFSLKNASKRLPHTIELRDDEVAGDEQLKILVTYEGRLIKKYTGKKPKF